MTARPATCYIVACNVCGDDLPPQDSNEESPRFASIQDAVRFVINEHPAWGILPDGYALCGDSDESHESVRETIPALLREPDRYWTIWTADRLEIISQVCGPDLVDADSALRQATTKPYDFEHTKANSYVEETDRAGFDALLDWDALSEDEKARLRPSAGGA